MAERPHASTADPQHAASAASDVLGLYPRDAFDADALTLAEQSAGIGVWSIDLVTGLARGTAQYFRIMGLEPTSEPMPMERVRALRHPEDRDRVVEGFRRALDGGSDAYEIEYRIIRPDGEIRWIFGRGRVLRDEHGRPVRYSGVDLDITERKAAEAALAAAQQELLRMNQMLEERVRERTAELAAEAERRAQAEARLHQAQKMEAVGQLTGGVAHDFNNVLQVIIGNLELARLALARAGIASIGAAVARVLDAIATAERASHNAQQTVQRLLAFSRMQPLAPCEVDTNALVCEMAGMIGHTLGETIDLALDLEPTVWSTFADRNQLQTALLNLVVNARDAMPDGGRLTIATANVRAPGDVPDELVPGDYVRVTVSDTGCGIPAEHLPKVFEPFFSTKDVGKGSGLGLSMVYGFVKQSGGAVRITSAVAKGSSMALYLPRFEAAPRSISASSAKEADYHQLPHARPGESVLLVEDYDDARDFAAMALEGLGYAVLQAPDGPTALRVLEQRDARVDLLFSDVVLPNGISGRALAEAARERRPGLPVLFATGYTSDAAVQQGRFASDVRVLAKPYSIETLACNVRDAIDVASATLAAGVQPRRGRILVVDDNADLATTLCAVLNEWGHSANVARDGPSALAALESTATDLALLDIGLPRMDGYELARRIRADPRHAGVRLVALSGLPEDADSRPAARASFHAYVQKPIDFARLEALLAEQLGSRGLH